MMQSLYDRLKDRFNLGEFTGRRADLAFVTVSREQLRPLLLHLRDLEGFTHLVLLTAVDWIEDDTFQLTYLLNDRARARDIGVRLMLPRDDTQMDSIHDLWPTAATYQRELREMFGIDFPDSPRVNEDFILEGWVDIPPYRREFDTLRFARETYPERPGRETHDPATYMKQQLYPDGEDNG
ncbi:MAG: NADH-quinone oxidoreductase subunit C [Gammaproteobacteria bacterium]|nr:NADH-quinone oxidoreductase subunit C [Gammaproteobacteria bacterium]